MQAGMESVAAATSIATTFDPLPLDTVQNPPAAGVFANLIGDAVGGLNTDIAASESSMQALAAGKTTELHDLMINLERARISVQTFVQVRNKLIESYQDLMRIQL